MTTLQKIEFRYNRLSMDYKARQAGSGYNIVKELNMLEKRIKGYRNAIKRNNNV